jgi:hypothetical protein
LIAEGRDVAGAFHVTCESGIGFQVAVNRGQRTENRGQKTK